MNRFPHPGDEVMLSVPQRETVHATVAAIGDGFIDLEMQSSPRTPMHVLERMRLYIEFINDEGIARLHGGLQSVGGGRLNFGRGGDDVVRFAHRHQVQLLQRRERIRAYASLKCDLWRPGRQEGPPITTRTVDISGGGLLVRGIPLVRPGEEYHFELTVDERALPLCGRFSVDGVTAEGDARVSFTAIEQRDRSLIIHMAFDIQREQRRSVA